MTNFVYAMLALVAVVSVVTGSTIRLYNQELPPCPPGESCLRVGECRFAQNRVINRRKPFCGFSDYMIQVCCSVESPSNISESTYSDINTRGRRETTSQKPKNNNTSASQLTSSPSVTACQQFRQSFDRQRYPKINIVGGRRTKDNQLPFMAALGYSAVGSSDIHWDCGGNLISDRYVLTAAHCITNNRARGRTLVTIRLGEKNLVSKARNNSDYGVKSIILHPQYKPSLRYKDIALIHMDRAVTFTHLIRPACLPPSSGPAPSNGTRMVVAGWGAIDQAGFTRSEYLKEAQVVIVSRKKCQELIKAQRGLPQGVTNDMICAGDFRRGDDTCLGDSGGPLVVPCVNSATCTVIGITSFGSNPCGSNVPAVYTRVSSFVPWIESVVWP